MALLLFAFKSDSAQLEAADPPLFAFKGERERQPEVAQSPLFAFKGERGRQLEAAPPPLFAFKGVRERFVRVGRPFATVSARFDL